MVGATPVYSEGINLKVSVRLSFQGLPWLFSKEKFLTGCGIN